MHALKDPSAALRNPAIMAILVMFLNSSSRDLAPHLIEGGECVETTPTACDHMLGSSTGDGINLDPGMKLNGTKALSFVSGKEKEGKGRSCPAAR